MKTLFYTKTLIALAVAIAAAASAVSQAQEQPIPPPAGDNALPAGIVPGSPLADVVKMVQAGVDAVTVGSYIANSQSAFNLDADKIDYLKDIGVSSDLINAMLNRDKMLYASTVTPVPVPVSDAAPAPDTGPLPAEVTVDYFNDALAPYGSWVNVDNYGRCWRPTAVIYDAAWRPYCDRGHWVNSDYGWYWDSDYSWGVTFHYGRWFRDARFGWCWYPDTVWAPSWVTWRSSGDYCGWAPLPPLAVFRPGIGFFYHGVNVGVDFDFGLDVGYFTFISADHFNDRRPRYYSVEPQRAAEIFRQSRVINNFTANRTTIINRGIPVQQISVAARRPIETVRVGSLPNAGRQGWRGEGFDPSASRGAFENNPGRNLSNGNSQLRHGPVMRGGPINDPNSNRRLNPGQPVPSQGGNPAVTPRSPSSEQPGNRNGQNNRNGAMTSPASQPPMVNVPANNNNGQTISRLQRPGNPQPLPQARQVNIPAAPQRPLVTDDSRQNRSFAAPNVSVPTQHPSLQLEQRPTVAPSAPRLPVVAERPVQNQNIAAPAPRNFSPPPPPAPAPAPAAPSPHNAGNGSDKDKQNH